MTAVSRRRATAVGTAVPNTEWVEKTTGAARYAGDVRLPGMLHAAVCRSPHPHARILSLDAAPAAASPGVVATLTAADLPDRRYIHHGGPMADRRVLADGVVRFVGEEVAAVAAETLPQARAAAARFRIRYRRLAAATTVEAARDPHAARVHPHAEGNVALSFGHSAGQADPARPPAVTVSGTYRFPRQNHACMETNTIVASWDAEHGRLSVWVSSQAPHFVRKELAHVLDLAEDQVVVHEVAVGGGFGSKSKISEYEAIAAALSMKTGRPVRLALTREEEFATTKSRHRFQIGLSTAATADGLLCARQADIVVDNGAYNHSGPSVMGAATGALASLYRVPETRYAATLVYTNTHPGGQFRGFGNPQATFAMESQMDELADRLGMDPIELRLRNVNRAGDVTHAGYRLDSANLAGCLEAVRDAIDWKRRRAAGGDGRGVGVATAIQVSGAYVYPGANRSSAGVDIGPGGTVLVRFGGADAGTGQRTLLAQIAAEELGVAVDRVSVLMMESDATPPDHGAWSSRGTYMGGHAVRAAARAAARTVHERADGVALTLAELVARTGPISVTAEYVADVEELNHRTGRGNISGAYSFAAHAVEVEVDRRTGRVRVLQVVAAHDSGLVVNPLLADSQVVGGVMMGIGVALGEELIYQGGRMVNPGYLYYALPRAADAPPVRALFVPGTDPNGPYGAKGLGEIVAVPTATAVANAVAHAVGVRIRELPLTPDRVLDALREKEGRPRARPGLARRPRRWGVEVMRRAYPRGLFRVMRRVAGDEVPVHDGPGAAPAAPASLAAAAEALRAPDAVPLAGGTDLVPAARQGLRPVRVLVDVTSVPDLTRTEVDADGCWHIGAAVRLAELVAADPDTTPAGAVSQTVRTIASAQIREVATVAGNLCQQNRCWFLRNDFACFKRSGPLHPCYAVTGDHRFYHAVMNAHRCQAVTPSDLATTLCALDAVVVVARAGRMRRLPLRRFYTGPGEPALRHGELVVAVEIPASAATRRTAFTKLNRWTGDFAMASAAVSLRLDGGRITDARVVLGAVAPTPVRVPEVERALVNLVPVPPRGLDAAALDAAAEAWTGRAHPLPGNRWKLDAASGLIASAVQRCLAGAP
jgi:CO/xanthine dehydrogenase Mo-binding subunit/CO/xanthine dehydrogenase FAD-binding subunit